MSHINEPHTKRSSCSYCGDAPLNHALSFTESLISITLDNHFKRFFKYVPSFLKNFVDAFPGLLFRTLEFFKLVKFSKDINKAKTFRSRIIWEEAEKRGIVMEQVIFSGRPLDFYRTKLNDKDFYFESIPIKPRPSDFHKNWDDKVFLKQEFKKHDIPVPAYFELSPFCFFSTENTRENFFKLVSPAIVKPRVGSRGRHTVININTFEQLKDGINIAGEICSYLIVEEHLRGSVCRATFVNKTLAGFYRGQAPVLIGDGKKTIRELITDLDNKRQKRVEPIRVEKELQDHIARSGFNLDSILPAQASLPLSHRIGRLFGGQTKEMIDELHPSFIPVLRRAVDLVDLSVVGFDCIIPDPTKPADSQRWGIIECNTLPFIDLHYYALEGKPKNIAGMIWDMWEKK